MAILPKLNICLTELSFPREVKLKLFTGELKEIYEDYKTDASKQTRLDGTIL